GHRGLADHALVFAELRIEQQRVIPFERSLHRSLLSILHPVLGGSGIIVAWHLATHKPATSCAVPLPSSGRQLRDPPVIAGPEPRRGIDVADRNPQACAEYRDRVSRERPAREPAAADGLGGRRDTQPLCGSLRTRSDSLYGRVARARP